MTEMSRTCSTYGAIQKCIHHLVGKHEGKRPLRRPRRRWEDNIKMNLRAVSCLPGDWIALAEDRDQWRDYVRAVMNPRVP